MTLCLDTNAYSALMRGNTEIKHILETVDELIVPTVVLDELYAGFAAGSRQSENESRIARFLRTPGTRVACVDPETAERYGRLVGQLRTQGTPILTNDKHFSVVPLLAAQGWSETGT